MSSELLERAITATDSTERTFSLYASAAQFACIDTLSAAASGPPTTLFSGLPRAEQKAVRYAFFVVPPGQSYYWSRAWQEGEQESVRELEAGEALTFHDMAAALAYLMSDDE